MKKVIRFSKLFIPAAVISIILVTLGIVGYFMKGFSLGVDFQPGSIQEVLLAPTAVNIRWTGTANARIQFDRGNLFIIISGSGVESRTYTFSFSEYRTIGSLVQAMAQQLEELDVTLIAGGSLNSQWLQFSSYSKPELGDIPYVIHYLEPDSEVIEISEVRSAMAAFGQGVSVQNIGSIQNHQFMIRTDLNEEQNIRSEQVIRTLESYPKIGKGGVAILSSTFVGSRFSKALTDQAGLLIVLTLVLILIYSAVRFKLQYAFGAVIAIAHDAIIMIAFIVWFRMEFNITTIAAILTILGYSINNSIILFDRIRENLRINPDRFFLDILNLSLTGILGRSIITTATTMLAVLSLFIFTTGSMKDFALALLVGMTSGFYTTMFIVPCLVNLGEAWRIKRVKRKSITA
jgi:preprotein translocase subunit SecF